MTTPDNLAHSLIHTSLPALTPHGVGEILAPGSTFRVTEQLIEATRDRNGETWTDLIGDDAAQVEKYGFVRFRRGPAPVELLRPQPGSADFADAREAARQSAHRIEDEVEKHAALQRVRDEFGPAPTSRTLSTFNP